MSEKHIIRFSPADADRVITAVSVSAFEEYGEVIPYEKLPVSEEIKVKLKELSYMVKQNTKRKETYEYAAEVSRELSCELADSFEVIETIEKLDPDRVKRYAECSIRPLPPKGYPLLDNFLYDAIFIPQGVEPPPFEIMKQPDLQVYVENFGSRRGDTALAAVHNDKIVGMAWARIMDDYGHIDDETPSIAISVKKNFRGCGIGMQLMANLLISLCRRGFNKVSLAVQRENHTAVKLYIRLGFRVLYIKGEEYIMVFDLKKIKG